MKRLSVLRYMLGVAIVGVLLMFARSASAVPPHEWRVVETNDKGWVIEVGQDTGWGSVANSKASSVARAYKNATGKDLTPEVLDIPENYEQDKQGGRSGRSSSPPATSSVTGSVPRISRGTSTCGASATGRTATRSMSRSSRARTGRLLIKMAPIETRNEIAGPAQVVQGVRPECRLPQRQAPEARRHAGSGGADAEEAEDTVKAAEAKSSKLETFLADAETEKAALVVTNDKLSRTGRLRLDPVGPVPRGRVRRRRRHVPDHREAQGGETRDGAHLRPQEAEELRSAWAEDHRPSSRRVSSTRPPRRSSRRPRSVDPEQVKNQVEK